jgi:TRAP-type mannitol/chloroaromatic compound transport system substrate-binding protein
VACADAHQHNYALFTANNGPALQRLVAAGVNTHLFPDDVWDAYGRGAAEVLGGYMGDAMFKKISDSAMASMRDTAGWLSLADTPYTAQRARVLGML